MSDEDETDDRVPPTAAQVARRALVLSAVVCRGSIDGGAGDPHAENLPGRIRQWLERAGLVEHLEPSEAEIMGLGLGQLTKQQRHQATWAVEGLAVLAGALGCRELPKHDQLVDPFDVTGSVGFLSDEAATFVEDARLESGEKLRAYREVMYALHCRLRGFLRTPRPHDISRWFEDEWLAVLGIDRASLYAGNDLRLDGKAISDVPIEQVQRCEAATCERHRASIWLIGEEYPSYWGWGVDT